MGGGVAWVTGGATGLGAMVARKLADRGYSVAVNYRDSKEQAEELVRDLQKSGGKALALKGDVADPEVVKGMVSEIEKILGGVDILICAAGPFLFRRIPTVELKDNQWREMVDGNLSGAFYCVRETVPGMRRRGWGRVITFGFPEVENAPHWEGYSAYAASKAGLVSFTRTLAREEAPHGITVNMVCPGDIRHPFKEAEIEAARGKQDPKNPVGRPGTGEDLARVIQFLVEADSDFITGGVIPVTGGFDNDNFETNGD